MAVSWGMIVDLDKCTGCQACVVACQAENNIPINDENSFKSRRAIEWMRIERYWEGEFPDVKARFMPVFCQHCADAPCEPVCPVYATYHNNEGLNVQVYNRCIGTRFCANGCPYHARYFNFWEPEWPESLTNQLNPDVTVRSRGIMEKCTFCVQRIRRTGRKAAQANTTVADEALARSLNPACVNSCPTQALEYGDVVDVLTAVKEKDRLPREPISNLGEKMKKELPEPGAEEGRGYFMLEELGVHPSVVYLRKVDEHVKEEVHG
ncbi:MAG: 4Fe-4S dicluster domain-containing protein [SAR202 cluster bacterium]|jgi:molybdopterin-containing oxidoreductase family iron-sulfur binding subunit|nr:4Fe-4S ferredoxin [Chloroflexota bacterium]MDP6422197.1 4Fe-4S dicluster domain-containing protein [SAR202 cluster bacterium]HAL49440.1 4Fe-4S ferredoxin [Dehalococcoidia bacterium]MDP6663488.1 4Fe-4S dicluster domain-containing protein [SAR202 cluster bacterium]MDP6799848.1 4Fe-4S dicluster domain-containing protein [SAR202 cluster bacterium]